MKHLISILCITAFITLNAKAQGTFYSTNYKQECWWNESTSKYDNCKGSEESSLFKLNSGATMFHHTTEKISSDYYVTKKEYDKENNVYTYDVKSDAGNTYYFIIDTTQKQIRIVGNNKTSSNQTYIHVYTVKKSWTE